jgi:hypothetical protein
MGLLSTWNRRGFLGTAAAVLASILAPTATVASRRCKPQVTANCRGATASLIGGLGLCRVLLA